MESAWSGGHATQLTQYPGFYPIESPDGQDVYFFRNKGLWRVRTDGSGEEAVKGMPELNSWGDKWFPSDHEFVDLETEKVRRVYQLEKPAPDWIGGMPVSSDGRWLFFPQLDERSSNLMMIENWQ